ncbi:MAG: hypothetical protein KJZ59_10545, partial [Pararhodobacter sp.]|nr:hypothetical protein [Pararhodobacter sp.]
EAEASGPRHTEADEQREIARYRADLERSVRRSDTAPGAASGAVAGATPNDGAPHRPARPTAQRTERPRSAQPPLVLVSEQRIDRPAVTEIVHPRR